MDPHVYVWILMNNTKVDYLGFMANISMVHGKLVGVHSNKHSWGLGTTRCVTYIYSCSFIPTIHSIPICPTSPLFS